MRTTFPQASVFAVLVAAALVALSGGPVLSAGTPASAELPGERVALVIGNGGYGDLGTLPNPPNDASDIAEALEQLDFKVTRVIDGNASDMRRALRDFGSSASGADVALFYYAGHGMALRGENYLVPVQAHIENELDLRYETLDLGDVRDALEFTGARLKMVILDACRDNPLAKMLQRKDAALGRGFALSDGLAPMDVDQASGMFIAYATAPGSVALDGSNQRNSPFTKALLSHIATPNVDVRVMFGDVRADVMQATNGRQTPWTEEAMLGEFEFKPQAEAPAPPDDFAAWSKIAASEDPADLEAFLRQFPDSALAGAARAQLKILRDPATEASAYGKLRGSTNVADYETFLHRYPDGTFASAALVTLQGLLSGQLAASKDIAGMQAYVARFPDGPFTQFVRANLAQLMAGASAPAAAADPVIATPAPAPNAADPMAMALATPGLPDPEVVPTGRTLTLVDPPSTPPVSGAPAAGTLPPEVDLSPASVERLNAAVRRDNDYLLQLALAALDYYNGKLDGKFGPASRRSAAAFQTAIGAEPTGELDASEIVTLIARAAKSGDADSQNTYGGMFEVGAGVFRDPVAAAKWYRLAAEAGNTFAQANLARLDQRE